MFCLFVSDRRNRASLNPASRSGTPARTLLLAILASALSAVPAAPPVHAQVPPLDRQGEWAPGGDAGAVVSTTFLTIPPGRSRSHTIHPSHSPIVSVSGGNWWVRSLARGRPTSLERLLDTLSFALRSEGRAHGTGRLTAWGCGDFPGLADGGGPAVVDREVRSVGTVSGLDTGARVGGNYMLRMIRVHPYMACSVSRGVEVRASLGLGRGTLRTRGDLGGALRSRDTALGSGAAGISARLFQHRRSIVKLKGETGLAQIDVAAAGAGLAAEKFGMLRLALATEAPHEYDLPSGLKLAPRGEVGLRHDGGDGEAGAGVELGAGPRLSDPGTRRTMDGFGHRPMTDGGALPKEWGFGAAFTLDREPSVRGLSARLTQSWERAGGGLHRLWEDENAGGPPAPVPGPRLELELGYGFGAFGGRGVVKPFGALSLDGDSGRGYRAGVRIYSSPAASLSLEVERRELRHAAPEHAAMLRGRLRF